MRDRPLAGLLAALVLVSAVAGVLPGAAVGSTVPTSPASQDVTDDLATVPDANIQADIPQQAQENISYNISQWRGSVMTTQGATSLEVSLTTRAAATGQPPAGDPQFALKLADDHLPDGRSVALPADALETAIGYQPVVVQGYHEDGSRWTASARERGNLIVFEVPHFSSNTVTFGGEVSISATPATDGSSYSYEVQDVDAVQDFQINVTGSTAYDRENASGTVGNGGSVPLQIAGNSAPVGPGGTSTPEIVLEGVESSSTAWTNFSGVTAGTSDVVTIGGNQMPENQIIQFEGSTATTSAGTSASGHNDGTTTSYTVDGNIEPTGPSSGNEPQITFTGVGSSTSTSTSATGHSQGSTTSYTVDGNLEPTGPSSNNEPEIQFSGNTQSTANDQSASNFALDSIISITTNGNIAPSGPSANNNPEVTVTADSTFENNITDGDYSGGSSDYTHPGPGVVWNQVNVSAEIDSTPESIQSITFSWVAKNTDCSDGTGDITARLVGDNSDGKWGEGTAVGTKTIDIENAPNSGTLTWSFSPVVVESEEIEVELISSGFSASSTTAGCTLLPRESSSDEIEWRNTKSGAHSTAIGVGVGQGPPQSVTVSDGNGHTANLGDFSTSGESKTTDLNMDIVQSLSTSGAGENVDLTLDKDDRTASEDPAVDWDGDGTIDASYSGLLKSGQTHTVELAGLSTGSHTAETSLTAGSVDWTLEFSEESGSENPAIDWDNDGTIDASHSGILRSGETATYELAGLSTGSHTAETQLDSGSVGWSIDWTTRTAVEDPGIDIGDDGTTDWSYSGILRAGETASVSLSSLDLGTNTVGWTSTADGTGFEANVSVDEVTVTEDPAVDVDSDGTYEISHVGTISPGSTTTYDASSLLRSTSSLDVQTNNASEVLVEAQYREVTKTASPSVEVNGNTTSGPAMLNDGEQSQLSTDPDWVRSETNRINVSLGTGSLSADAPQLEVDLDYTHESVDNQTVSYEAQRWTERYNVSRTWLSDQNSAYLTIPFKDTVLSIRDVEKRVGSNSWTDLQNGDYSFSNGDLTVQLGSIQKNTEVGVRVNASRVRVNNGELRVTVPTPVGRTLDTQIVIESWHDDSYIELPQRDPNLVAYAYNESWSGPVDDMRVTADGERRLRLPNALAQGQTNIATVPVEADPVSGDVVVSVGSPSSTEPQFTVLPGTTNGDTVEFTFTGAADGTDYLLYSNSEGIVRDSGTASSPITLTDDDSAETLQFLVDEGDLSSGPDDGGGGSSGIGFGSAPSVSVQEAQANPLGTILVVILALVILLGAYWAVRRRERPVRGLVGDVATFISTEVVLIGLTILGIVLALRFNVLALPEPALFVAAVFAIEVGGYLLLRYFGLFDLRVYIAASFIVLVAVVQLLAPGVFREIAGSQSLTRLLPLVLAAVLYLVYRVIQTWRRGQVTNIVISGESGGSE